MMMMSWAVLNRICFLTSKLNTLNKAISVFPDMVFFLGTKCAILALIECSASIPACVLVYSRQKLERNFYLRWS